MIIRRLTTGDAGELAAVLVENREFLANSSPIGADGFFTAAGQRERIESGGSERFAILDGGHIAGTVSLSNIVLDPLQNATLGYWVAERVSGRGLATRAVREIVGIAFEELGLHRLEAATLVDNAPSQRVLEKNGFERIGLAHRYLHIAGEWRDHLLFQRTAD